MPANKKHLTTSKWQRFLKFSAGFLGGYLVSMSLHMALAQWLNHVNVLITITFSGFILWVALFLLAFLAKNGWKVWGLYLLLTLFFSGCIYLGKLYHPIIS
ncbi:hypothetical protein [Polaribacter cellanae]|uniref:DUF3649 domain-containing protein n=1 Tax=Polaribacter cellanae TaxID=2818493 RepID=A0A975CP16_9FLAO|nr:hypothetical protein [Polaribacter cellanae]QTE22612.1 hypothetical protein J3359_17750 [Polaribacter cellanae]